MRITFKIVLLVACLMSMLPGAHKVYSTPDSSFWCCVGTGFENHAKYGEAIYSHNENELFVNLFIPSELIWQEQGVTVSEYTNFPQDGKTTLTVNTNEAKDLKLQIRYPSWATNGASIKVNGKKLKVKEKPGSYIVVNRKWNDGDKVKIEYPMELKVNPSDNPDVISITYGPIVLAAEMGTEDMQSPAPFSNPNLYNDYYTYDFHVPANLTNKLNVKGEKADKAFTLSYLSDIHHQRYIVYWHLK